MAARTPRRSFAAPFVLTLAAAPACYVQSSPGTTSSPPPGPPPTQTSEPQPQPQQPPVVIANPPPPTTQPQQPPPSKPPVVIANPPPPTTQTPPKPAPKGPIVVANPTPPTTQGPATPTPTTSSKEARWTVYKAKDGCMAAIKVECVPKATCNPPPPFKYACPENVSLEKPITVATYDGTSCFVEYEAPKCPPGAVCNPPRPRAVTCPTPNR